MEGGDEPATHRKSASAEPLLRTADDNDERTDDRPLPSNSTSSSSNNSKSRRGSVSIDSNSYSDDAKNSDDDGGGGNNRHSTTSGISPTSSSSSSSNSNTSRNIALLLNPLTDEAGSPLSILFGLTTLLLFGFILGMSLPTNPSLPTPWYRRVSNIIGYTYFTAWSISFYPQVITNYRRKSTRGLSQDFCSLNVLGFTCYAVYNVSFFWSTTIRNLYRKRYGDDSEITVQSNDVAFALHALMLSSVTLCQIGYYDGLKPLTRIIGWFVGIVLFVCAVYATLVLAKVDKLNWLDYLYLLSFVKVVITLIKYVPQVVLNVRRKSTSGWNIWNVLMDLTGGVLSVLQLLGDCADLNDWDGITGNLAKFCLGFVSIAFDIIFILQHYVLYPGRDELSAPLIIQDDYEVL